MIGYVTIGTEDLERARTYYDALFESIGAKRLMQLEDQRGFTMYGVAMNRPAVVVTRPYNGEPMHAGNGNMVALVMDSCDRSTVPRPAMESQRDDGAPVMGDPKVRIISLTSATSTQQVAVSIAPKTV